MPLENPGSQIRSHTGWPARMCHNAQHKFRAKHKTMTYNIAEFVLTRRIPGPIGAAGVHDAAMASGEGTKRWPALHGPDGQGHSGRR